MSCPRPARSRLCESALEGKPKDVHAVQVIIRPKVVVRAVEHAAQKRYGLPEITTPVATTASVTRDGRLYRKRQSITPSRRFNAWMSG